MSTIFIKKGIEYIKKAVEKDDAKQYSTALVLYSKGIQYLLTGLKYEKHQKVQELLKKKIHRYLIRAEAIKKHDLKDIQLQYPDQLAINKQSQEANIKSKQIVYAYIRHNERIFPLNHSIPEGIISTVIIYYYTKPTYLPDPLKHRVVSINRSTIALKDVFGLDEAKIFLKQHVILPLKYPQLFNRYRSDTKVLIYGPSGCGKSHLVEAIASEVPDISYLNFCVSHILSKTNGEAEKLIKNVFAMAREQRPCILVIDDIDCISSHIDPIYSEDSSPTLRRMRTELLVQLGYDIKDLYIVFITNKPWDLNSAIRHRISGKMIYIGIPDAESRKGIVRYILGDCVHNLSENHFEIIAEKTEGWTGYDIQGMVRDAIMEPVREVQSATHFRRIENGDDYVLVSCNADEEDAIKMTLMEISDHEQNKIKPGMLNRRHFLKVISESKATVSEDDIQKYIDWNEMYHHCD